MSADQEEFNDALQALDEEGDHLPLPTGSQTKSLVNSPTIDTLDSVVLESSPTDDDLEARAQETEESPTGGGSRAPGGGPQASLSSQPQEEGARGPAAKNEARAVEDVSKDFAQFKLGDEGAAPQGGTPQLSSYFSSSEAGDSFFDSLAAQEAEAALGTALPPARTESAPPLPAQQAVPPQHPPSYERAISSEPESIGFEGETAATGELGGSQLEDLTEKEDFMVESFTAQGSDSGRPSSGVEVEPGHHGAGGEGPPSLEHQHQQQHQQQQSGLHPGFSLNQTPSVGTTPTQLSPLSTPVHHPVAPGPSSPQATPSHQPQTPAYEHQASLPSSPFHQFGSGPSSLPFQGFGEGGGEDPFSASLCMSDMDRRYDSWLPSDATRHILITMVTGQQGSVLPGPEQLSTPGLLHSEPLADPVRELIQRYMGEQEASKRQVLRAEDVTPDIPGLQRLIEAGCLRAALDHTANLLRASGQGEGHFGQVAQHSPYTLQVWFVRMALMMHLRLYDLAEAEIQAFKTLDTPDLYFEFYPHLYPGRRGSMVPFGLRLLHAELPACLGRAQDSLDRVYYILAVVNKIQNNLEAGLAEDGSALELSADSRTASIDLWKQREKQVLYRIASTFLIIKDYASALLVYEQLLSKDKDSAVLLKSGIGRIYLQMGNVAKASQIFKEVESQTEKGDNQAVCRNAINRGFVAMGLNNFSEAYQHFKTAVQVQPQNTCAVNNMAVCSLYLGRLKDALNTLETLVHSDPVRNLHEGILFNLCTLYELESSRALHKKQAVLDLVNKHKGDGFPTVCLKMS